MTRNRYWETTVFESTKSLRQLGVRIVPGMVIGIEGAPDIAILNKYWRFFKQEYNNLKVVNP